jgi:alpha-mannosidase
MVALDAPLVNFGDIVRGNWPAEFKPKTSTILSWLMNNYWGTNFPAWQGGDFIFRYVIRSDAQFDPAFLTRFGQEALTPLERDDIGAIHETSKLPAREAGMLAIDNPGITLLTWKHAEDGDGSILRLQESSGKASEVTVRSPYIKFDGAWLCSALEDNRTEAPVAEGAITVPIKPFQVLTIRVRTSPQLSKGEAQ